MGSKFRDEEVEQAIADAIAALRRYPHSHNQIADLVDAIEAYSCGTLGVAMVLAHGAAYPRRVGGEFRNVEAMGRSLADIERRFAELRNRRRQTIVH